MNSILKFQAIILVQLILTEVIFLLSGQNVLAVVVLLFSLIYIVIIEGYSRGLSKFNLKTKPAELDIEMVKEIEKSNAIVAKDLAKTINPESRGAAIKHNTELIENELDEIFKLGLQIGGYNMSRVTSIGNVKLEKDKGGKITGVVWDETY